MTRARRMRLGFSIGSIGYHYAAWRLPEASPDGGLSARHYIESAQLAERGKFDFVFVADVMAIRNFDDRRIAREREHGILKLEPTLALAAVAATTERVGLIPSVSTTYNPPYAFARRMASLDHISRGRAGWNMVTSFSLDEARNFSLDAPLDSATRHARAVEFVEVAKGLWDSWDENAFVRDKPPASTSTATGATFSTTRVSSSRCADRSTPRARRRAACRSSPPVRRSSRRSWQRASPIWCTRASRTSAAHGTTTAP